jgi:putative oxidoreductase
MKSDLGMFALRVVTGGLMAGHGAQKLFGSFGGPGLKGTASMMEHLGLQPGKQWGMAAALSEFAGGTLTALGLGGPLGPIGVLSSMTMAATTAHWGKPIWVTEGGAELPVTNAAVAVALAMAGPGRYSLDRMIGITVPRWFVAGAIVTAAGAIITAHNQRSLPTQQEEAKQEPDTQQAQRASA